MVHHPQDIENRINIASHFYTLSEAAKRLKVERHTIWRWIKAGTLPAQKAGGVVFIEKRVVDSRVPASQSETGSNE